MCSRSGSFLCNYGASQLDEFRCVNGTVVVGYLEIIMICSSYILDIDTLQSFAFEKESFFTKKNYTLCFPEKFVAGAANVEVFRNFFIGNEDRMK